MNQKGIFKRVVILTILVICTIIPLYYWMIDKDNAPENPNIPIIDSRFPHYLIFTDQIGVYELPNYAIVFRTQDLSQNSVYFGKSNSSWNVYNETLLIREHYFPLIDLEPATTYYYQINQSMQYHFQTPQNISNSIRIGFVSDGHTGSVSNPIRTKIIGKIQNQTPPTDYLVSLGDLVDYGMATEHWMQSMREFATNSNTIPFFSMCGNHESLLAGEGLYQRILFPNGHHFNSSNQIFYGRISINKVHLFILDLQGTNNTNSPEQMAWFEDQLKLIPLTETKIVLSHGFFYSSGISSNWYDNQDLINTFTPLFNQYNVSLVISGHNHQMEHLKVNSTDYCIIGTFGAYLEQPRVLNGTGSLWYNNENYGFLTVEKNSLGLNVNFYSTDLNVLHSFQI